MADILSAKDSVMLDEFVRRAFDMRYIINDIKRLRTRGMHNWGEFNRKLEEFSNKSLSFHTAISEYIFDTNTPYLMQQKLADSYYITYDSPFDELRIQEYKVGEQVIRRVLCSLSFRILNILNADIIRECYARSIAENPERQSLFYSCNEASYLNLAYVSILEREIRDPNNNHLQSSLISWLYDTIYSVPSVEFDWLDNGFHFLTPEEFYLNSYLTNEEGFSDKIALNYLERVRESLSVVHFGSDLEEKGNKKLLKIRQEACLLMLSSESFRLIKEDGSIPEEYTVPTSQVDREVFDEALKSASDIRMSMEEKVKMLV